MNKAIGYTGWILAVVALGGYAYKVDILRAVIAETERAASGKDDLIRHLNQEISRLTVADEGFKIITPAEYSATQDTQALQESLAAAEAEISQLKAASEMAELAAAALAATEPKDDGKKSNSFADMMSNMGENEEMMDAQSKMMVNMQYSSLFSELALPADVADQAKEILASIGKDQMEAGFSMMSGDGAMSGREMKEMQTTSVDQARVELSKILTADEMATWEDFEEHKEVRMMEQNYDMQLGMFAAGLTEENKTMVRDVMVDEAMLLQDALMDSEEAFSVEGQMADQLAIFQNARERLLPALDEDQYAIAESFLEQQESMIRMGMQMMEGMFDGEDIEEDVPTPAITARPRDGSSSESE